VGFLTVDFIAETPQLHLTAAFLFFAAESVAFFFSFPLIDD
jgi:hypothetical protein